METSEISEDNKLYVCENCDKTSNEHNFVAGKMYAIIVLKYYLKKL